jgi:hypothetical protein
MSCALQIAVRLKNPISVSTALKAKLKVVVNYGFSVITLGPPSNMRIAQKPSNGTYGSIVGDLDGVNTVFQINPYVSGKLLVFLNGVVQQQGNPNGDFIELDPSLGTIQFASPPASTDIITIAYE